MEAHAAEALGVALPNLGVGNRHWHQRHAEVGAAFGGERVRCGGEVIAVGGAMHDDAALDAKTLMAREQRLLRSVGGGVAAAKGKASRGPNTCTCASQAPGGNFNLGLLGLSVQDCRAAGFSAFVMVLPYEVGARVRSKAGSCSEKRCSHETRPG